MTDKEWKELCEWADNSRKITLSGDDEYVYYIEIFFDETTIIYVNKHGGIRLHKSYNGATSDSVIVWNRTYKQIKNIIANLVEDMENENK